MTTPTAQTREGAPSETPRISVIVPFFRSASSIAACVESLLAQNNPGGPVEILFVDNGSPDNAAEIVRRYPEIDLLHETKPGAYAARNAGLRQAGAPLIAFTDADCVPDPDWFCALVDTMEDPSLGIAIGHCRYSDQASWWLKRLAAYENAKAESVLRRQPTAYHFAYANNMVVRSTVFAEIGPFKEWQRAGDTELVHRLAAQSPTLRTTFSAPMRVTHLEFLTFRDRARRLSLYTETNAKIVGFRELSLQQRLGVLLRSLSPNRPV